MAGNQISGDGLASNLAGMSKNQLYEIMCQMKAILFLFLLPQTFFPFFSFLLCWNAVNLIIIPLFIFELFALIARISLQIFSSFA